MILERNGNFYRLWTSIWASAVNGQLSGNNLSEFVFHNPTNETIGVNIVQTTSGNESTDWEIVSSTNLLTPGETSLNLLRQTVSSLHYGSILKMEKFTSILAVIREW